MIPTSAHDVLLTDIENTDSEENKSDQTAIGLEETVEVITESATGEGAKEPVVGRLDPRNRLNDLTGREWLYFQNSVWDTRFKRAGKNAHAFDLRKAHPSPKPPELLAEIIRFFTKADGKVLDPFAGVGSTLLACALTGRSGVGMELNQQYVDIYRDICERSNGEFPQMPLLQGDARQLAQSERVLVNAPYSLILADPPYSDMLSRPRTKNMGSAATPYSNSENDLGNVPMDENDTPPYASFLRQLREILAPACQLLSPGGHMIIFCKDLQPTPIHHNLLHADLVVELLNVERISYRGMRIWTNQTPKLYPFGYPYQFVANQIHQYMLVFQADK